ncbi:MAG: YdbH domain-containing protein [Asticcacaulis sp.]
MKAQVTAATVADAMPADQIRFNPLVLTGGLTQSTQAMTGRFLASSPRLMTGGKPAPVADIALDADPVTGKGAVTVDTRDYLTFDPHGMQPVFLSPTVAAIFSKDVSGKAGFKGGFTFDKDTSASSGVLKVDGLNFTGAAGVSQGLNGQIVFTSLTPLLSEPHQTMGIDHMQLGVPLDKLELPLPVLADHLAVEQADVLSPGGPVLLQPMTVPFDGVSPISGTMTFDGLDFGKIIATTGLGGSMSFTGTVSGKLPFTVAGGHVSFIQGFLASDASGQISIKREAVTGVQATGTVSSPDTKAPAAAVVAQPEFNPFQDLAYQALEYITYDKIDAKINSIKGGVLDVNFHIKGYFDPPRPQKATVSLFDYISGKWMQKPIKLPSKTPVELYLDVPVNLDEILNDLTAFNVRTAQKPQ